MTPIIVHQAIILHYFYGQRFSLTNYDLVLAVDSCDKWQSWQTWHTWHRLLTRQSVTSARPWHQNKV